MFELNELLTCMAIFGIVWLSILLGSFFVSLILGLYLDKNHAGQG